MSFRFLRKRWSSGGERLQYEFDKLRYNKQVLKFEDKQTVTYFSSSIGSPGLAKANHPLSNSVPLAYFEVYIVNGGRESQNFSTIAVGLVTYDYPVDITPGSFRGSYGYHGGEGKKFSGVAGGIGEVYGPTFTTGDVIGVGLDNINNCVFFTKNGVHLGPAFKRVGAVELYPCVSLQSPGETAIINFSSPFVFDRSSVHGEDFLKREGDIARWDVSRCGKPLEVEGRKVTVSHDTSHSTIGVVQCTRPFSLFPTDPFCYFEVYIEHLDKGHASIGLANKEYPLNLHVGWLKRSYGYHNDDGRKFKWKEHDSGTNEGEMYGPGFFEGDTVGCGLNVQTREIYFTKNGTFLGVAFANVYGILYPCVALTGPGDSVVATFAPPYKYLSYTNPPSLRTSGGITNSTMSSSSGTNGNNTNESDSGDIGDTIEISDGPISYDSANGIFPNNSGNNAAASSNSSNSVPNTSLVTTTSGNALGSSAGVKNPLSLSSSMTMPPPTLASSPSQSQLGSVLTSSPSYSSKTLPNSKSPSGRSPQSSGLFNTFTHSGSRLTSSSVLNPIGSPPSSPRISVSEEIYVTPMSPLVSPAKLAPAPQGFMEAGAPLTVWKRCGKTLKQKDEITVTLAKKKTGAAQASRSCSSSHQLWYFEVYIECSDKRGITSVGLATDEFPLDRQVGRGSTSYAYHSEEGKKWNGELLQDYGPPYGGGDVVGCGFNTVTREIFFTRNGSYLGVAFWDVPQHTFYPTVSLRGATGMTAVATFQGPFRFDICDGLPAISPSVWSESLGPNFSEGGPLPRSRHSFTSWPANDVSIWLESIGYGRYNSSFCQNNISGRHLLLLTHALLKNELGIDSYGHRADILDRVKRMQSLWRERGGDDEFPEDVGSSAEYHNLRNTTLDRTFDTPPLQSPITRLNSTHILHNTNPDNYNDTNNTSTTVVLEDSAETPSSFSSKSITSTVLSSSAPLSSPLNFPPVHPPVTSRVPSSPTLSTVSPQQPSPLPSNSVSPNNSTNQPLPLLQEWEIDYDELVFGPVIGKGFFGEVKRGAWRETDVAIKIIYRDSFKTKNSLELFQNEVLMLSKLRHPNVVQFLGACTATDPPKLPCIVTEWMGGGSLRQFLTDYIWVIAGNSRLKIKIALDIAKGMNYLHGWTPPILHRDLSTRNILLDTAGDRDGNFLGLKCKVADFGLSRLKQDHGTMTSSVGCIPYMAPEVYKGDWNSEKSDVYSYGIILWELLTGEEPQQDLKPLKMAHLAAHAGYRPPIPTSTTPRWRNLITTCWAESPDARPTFKQIIAALKDLELELEETVASNNNNNTPTNIVINNSHNNRSVPFSAQPPHSEYAE